MYVSACIYRDGVHLMPGPNCPHGPDKNELGEDIKPGWTAQQADQQEGSDRG
jgi:hypothetical protein